MLYGKRIINKLACCDDNNIVNIMCLLRCQLLAAVEKWNLYFWSNLHIFIYMRRRRRGFVVANAAAPMLCYFGGGYEERCFVVTAWILLSVVWVLLSMEFNLASDWHCSRRRHCGYHNMASSRRSERLIQLLLRGRRWLQFMRMIARVIRGIQPRVCHMGMIHRREMFHEWCATST